MRFEFDEGTEEVRLRGGARGAMPVGRGLSDMRSGVRPVAPAARPSWLSADEDGGTRATCEESARDAAAEDYLRRHARATDDEDGAASGRLGLRERIDKSHRARVKERAGRAYFKQYEAGRASDAAQAGPRAAVYKGEMGATHKRSSRMQDNPATQRVGQSARASRPNRGSFFTRPPFMALVASVLCLAFAVTFLYGPARQLYTDMRERDRLEAEYEAVVQRNEAIGQRVEALQTDAGVEDVARSELGWVREGEYAVSVSGLTPKEQPEFRGSILSEGIPLPDTWYSGVLDPLFGVS